MILGQSGGFHHRRSKGNASICGNLAALAAAVLISAASGAVLSAADPAVETGVVRYRPADDESAVPERFRLAAHEFRYEMRPAAESSDRFDVLEVTYPSAVVTPYAENNTVHCELYRPRGTGEERVPAVIVLHILGGDFQLCRFFCNALAQNGVAAMLLKMPYYGPRRPAGVNRRMITVDAGETIEGMTQAVLDVRRGAALLGSLEQVDQKQLGIFGISLGGITAALAASAEPRIENVFLVLAGGDLGGIGWRSTELVEMRRHWESRGGTLEEYRKALAPIDPLTFAQNVRGRRIMMINANRDEVVPPDCTEKLWSAYGEPPILWLEGGHYSISRHIFKVLDRTVKFFQPSEDGK